MKNSQKIKSNQRQKKIKITSKIQPLTHTNTQKSLPKQKTED